MSIKVTIPGTSLPRGDEEPGRSFFAAETKEIENQRRVQEQDAERRIARVQARDRSNEDAAIYGNHLEEAAENGLLQHPYLDNPRFDGIDPNVNPEPPLNSDARREYDNQRREQEMEKQLRLGNMPKFNKAPKPGGPY